MTINAQLYCLRLSKFSLNSIPVYDIIITTGFPHIILISVLSLVIIVAVDMSSM
jgi:hypothetical protein